MGCCQPCQQGIQFTTIPGAVFGIGDPGISVLEDDRAVDRAVHINVDRILTANVDDLNTVLKILILTLVQILPRIIRVNLLGIDINNITGSPGAAPGDRFIVSEHDHRICERRISNNVNTCAMHAHRVNISRVKPTKLRAVYENGICIFDLFFSNHIHITETTGLRTRKCLVISRGCSQRR